MLDSRSEVAAGQRFGFGANWKSFVQVMDDDRIASATASLTRALDVPDLAGRSFLDIGCGSGLFSLAAQRLGATVHSFDFDPDSVAATMALRQRYSPGADWVVEQGSILDRSYTASLGQFDVVYSWGVLHHTGNMWQALAAAVDLTRPGGRLFVSIYNDQGPASRVWRWVKRHYNSSGRLGRLLLLGLSTGYLYRRVPLRKLLQLVMPRQFPPRPIRRGMSRRHDLVDWVGGYPFEVARPEQIFRFFRDRGFELVELSTCGGDLGCNEFVFRRRGGG
ncbi:class I SAM-dependent methyltransferase [Micromonospora sp. WMMD1102]|nr:class I SAM-dependent methyltransferase [Micromonospora sp. WMMD1102]MDG4786392.1 class I SAM-dependent methyltransferase [Micromonospora sp. WMMD1102]